jgi:hypothetical protein
MPRHRAAPAFAHRRPVRHALSSSMASERLASVVAPLRISLHKVCGPLSDGRKLMANAVVPFRDLRIPPRERRRDRRAPAQAPTIRAPTQHKSQSSTSRFDGRTRAQPPRARGNPHRGRGPPRPAPGLRANRNTGHSAWYQLRAGRTPRPRRSRSDLAASELELRKQGQRKWQNGRGTSRSRRTDYAVEHSAGMAPLLDPHASSCCCGVLQQTRHLDPGSPWRISAVLSPPRARAIRLSSSLRSFPRPTSTGSLRNSCDRRRIVHLGGQT